MFSNKTGSLSAICNFNFNSLCCSHFLFSRSPSSVLGPRIPFALNVLSTNLLNTFLLILTYLFTYLPNNLGSYLLTYLLYTHSIFTQSLTDSFTFTYYRKHNYYSLHRNCNRIEQAARAFWENPKTDFVFWGANPKTNHESMVLWVDSSDQIQIRIFEIHIHNLSVFLGKDVKKIFLTGGFPNKNGSQQML